VLLLQFNEAEQDLISGADNPDPTPPPGDEGGVGIVMVTEAIL